MGVWTRGAGRSARVGMGVTLVALAALGASGASTVAQDPVTLTIWSPENRPDDAAAHAWLIEQFQAQKLAETFDEHGLRLRLRLPATSYEVLAGRLRDLSRGAAELKIIEKTSQ